MKTDPEQKLNELFRAARASRRDTSRAEFAFETRLLARIRAEREQGGWLGSLIWAWRLCPAFAAVAVALAIWLAASGARSTDDLRDGAVSASSVTTGDLFAVQSYAEAHP